MTHFYRRAFESATVEVALSADRKRITHVLVTTNRGLSTGKKMSDFGVAWRVEIYNAGICSHPSGQGFEFLSVLNARALATTLIALRRRGVMMLVRIDKHLIVKIAREVWESGKVLHF